MHKRLHSGRRAPPPTLPRRRSQGFEVLGRVHYCDELRGDGEGASGDPPQTTPDGPPPVAQQVAQPKRRWGKGGGPRQRRASYLRAVPATSVLVLCDAPRARSGTGTAIRSEEMDAIVETETQTEPSMPVGGRGLESGERGSEGRRRRWVSAGRQGTKRRRKRCSRETQRLLWGQPRRSLTGMPAALPPPSTPHPAELPPPAHDRRKQSLDRRTHFRLHPVTIRQ